MSQQFLYQQIIENVDYSSQSLEKMEYEDCIFKNCDFSNCSLNGSRFIDTKFVDCNLSNARILEVSFQDVTFSNCKMLGLHFDQSKPFGFSVLFNNCQLNHSIFYQLKLGQSAFVNCQL